MLVIEKYRITKENIYNYDKKKGYDKGGYYFNINNNL